MVLKAAKKTGMKYGVRSTGAEVRSTNQRTFKPFKPFKHSNSSNRKPGTWNRKPETGTPLHRLHVTKLVKRAAEGFNNIGGQQALLRLVLQRKVGSKAVQVNTSHGRIRPGIALA